MGEKAIGEFDRIQVAGGYASLIFFFKENKFHFALLGPRFTIQLNQCTLFHGFVPYSRCAPD